MRNHFYTLRAFPAQTKLAFSGRPSNSRSMQRAPSVIMKSRHVAEKSGPSEYYCTLSMYEIRSVVRYESIMRIAAVRDVSEFILVTVHQVVQYTV